MRRLPILLLGTLLGSTLTAVESGHALSRADEARLRAQAHPVPRSGTYYLRHRPRDPCRETAAPDARDLPRRGPVTKPGPACRPAR